MPQHPPPVRPQQGPIPKARPVMPRHFVSQRLEEAGQDVADTVALVADWWKANAVMKAIEEQLRRQNGIHLVPASTLRLPEAVLS